MILVTGANGQLGKSVLYRLLKTGLPAFGLSSCSQMDVATSNSFLTVSPQLEDIMNLDVGDVSTIVHCAAAIPYGQVSAEKAAELNRKIDDNVLEFSKDRGASCIFISSTSVYGGIYDEVHEDSLAAPLTSYSLEKLRSENYFLESGVDTTVARISSPYGATKKYANVLWAFIEKACKGDDLTCFGTGARSQDFTYTSDIASFVLLALTRNENGIFNVTSGKDISMLSLAELIVNVLRSDSRITVGMVDDPDEDYRAKFSITKANRVFEWFPSVQIADGIFKIREHLLGQGIIHE